MRTLKAALAARAALSAHARQSLRALSALPATRMQHSLLAPQQQRAFSQQQPRDDNGTNRSPGAKPPKSRAVAPPRQRRSNTGKLDLRFQRDGERREHRERFEVDSVKAQRWMEIRASARDFTAIAQSVADCYEPLFRTHPALAGLTCPLSELLAETVRDGDADGKGFESDELDAQDPSVRGARLPRYLEDRTKMMEQLAIEFLFKGGEAELAVAVYENRRFVSSAIAASGLARTDREQRMHEHYRSFFSLATGAYAALNRHEQVVQVYEDVVESHKLWPTVSMNVNYVRALATLRRFDRVAAAYKQISASDGFQNVFFYRNMLFYAGVAGDTMVLHDVLAKMRELRFALRPVDFAHCVRAFDSQYYLASSDVGQGTKKKSKPVAVVTPVSYVDVVSSTPSDGGDNLSEDARAARRIEQDAASEVLAIFDQFLQVNEKMTPVITEDMGKQLYPRVLTAAFKLADYARVASIVALRRQRGNALLGDDALQLAVTGLLLSHRPEDAWRLVEEEYEHRSPHPRAYMAVVSNLLGYLCLKEHQQHAFLILKLLDDLKRRKTAPGIVSNAHVRAVIDTLCADKSALDDRQLYQLVVDHNAIFRVLDQPFWFANFLASCHVTERFAAAKSAFQQRNAQDIPTIPVALAIECMKSFSELEDFEFVFRLFHAVKLCTKTDRREVCYLAMRACEQVEWLGRDAIQEIYETHLKHQQSLELPEDIKLLVGEA